MRIFHMALAKIRSGKYSACILQDEYRELMTYARERKVKLEGFKKFSGDISLIKELVDDIVTIADDFPRILSDRRSVVVRLDEHLQNEDFATTDRHLISINADVFNDREYLECEYEMLANKGKFVKGTTYRSVIRHELGHVVANIYMFDPMEIAKCILFNTDESEIIRYVKSKVSLYASDFEDGREFISECFSAYYSNIDNSFAEEYVNKCKELGKEDAYYEKK